MSLQMSKEGIQFLKRWEGVRRTSYEDSGGAWTIGVGHLINLKHERHLLGATISMKEVEELLAKDLKRFEKKVTELFPEIVVQHKFDALVSLAFNIGTYAFSKSTLVRVMKNPRRGFSAVQRMRALESAWKMWKYDNGIVVKGLVNRRKAEVGLYFEGKYNA